MVMFWFIPVFCLIISACDFFIKNQNLKKTFIYVSVLIIASYTSFTWVGNDSIEYRVFYNQVPVITEIIFGTTREINSLLIRLEPAYLICLVFFKSIGISYDIFEYIFRILILSIAGFAFTKRTSFPLFAFSTYILANIVALILNQMRFGMALSLCLLGFSILQNQNNKRIAIGILAVLFHYSAVLVLVFFILNRTTRQVRFPFWSYILLATLPFVAILSNFITIEFLFQFADFLKLETIKYRLGIYLVANSFSESLPVKTIIFHAIFVMLLCGVKIFRILPNNLIPRQWHYTMVCGSLACILFSQNAILVRFAAPMLFVQFLIFAQLLNWRAFRPIIVAVVLLFSFSRYHKSFEYPPRPSELFAYLIGK